jgi:uroporphyrinogen-III synthase
MKSLEKRGAKVLRLPVYRWGLPEDTAPLCRTLEGIADNQFDVALFTTGTQIWHLFKLAYRKNMEAELRAGLNRMVISSVGPTTSEALREFEIDVDFEPDHPKMGPLVNQTAQRAHALLLAKKMPELVGK